MKDLFEGLDTTPQKSQETAHAADIMNRASSGYLSGKLIGLVAEGWLDQKDAYIALRMMRDACDSAMQILNEDCRAEFVSLPKDQPHAFGDYQAEVRNSAGRWSFTDDEYKAQKARLKEMEEQRKSAYHGLQNGSVVYDSNTGAEIPPANYTAGKETIYLTRRKK